MMPTNLQTPRIAPAEASDIEEILKLQYTAYQSEALIHNDFTIQPLVQTLDETIEEYSQCVFLKTALDGEIIGSVRAREKNGTVYIGKLMVHPNHQGKGLGKRLLTAIEQKFPNRRYELFTSCKSGRNLHLYETAGYVRFREEIDSAGIAFAYLEKGNENRRDIASLPRAETLYFPSPSPLCHTPMPLLQRLSLLPYNLLWLPALPTALLRLFWRARKQPAYLRHVQERFGSYHTRAPGPVIWVHAVSLGETRAAEPLVRALLERWPEHTIVLTHMTPTGREASEALFDGNNRVLRVYLPYDFGPFVARFLRHFRPMFGIIMETEIWPMLLTSCRQRNVPILLVNARLSERSARRYARLPALTRFTLRALTAIGAQSAADAARLTALGAHRVSITGNIKFDVEPSPEILALGTDFRTRRSTRPTIFAASTREGEEEAILDAFVRARPFGNPETLLILTPRHPQRFDEVEALIRARGLTVTRRSAAPPEPLPIDTQVWLGDSTGEMFAYYMAADVAMIGGSWQPFGGQNPIEACTVGTPILLGPHTFNFQRIADEATEVGAARRCNDIESAMRTAFALLEDPATRTAMSEAGHAFAAINRGATARTIALLDQLEL